MTKIMDPILSILRYWAIVFRLFCRSRYTDVIYVMLYVCVCVSVFSSVQSRPSNASFLYTKPADGPGHILSFLLSSTEDLDLYSYLSSPPLQLDTYSGGPCS